jgi:hypothetical protein
VGCVSALRPPLPRSLLAQSAASPRRRDALATAARRLASPDTARTDTPGVRPGSGAVATLRPGATTRSTQIIEAAPRPSSLRQHSVARRRTAWRPAIRSPSAQGLALASATSTGRSRVRPAGTVQPDAQRQPPAARRRSPSRCAVSPSPTEARRIGRERHGEAGCVPPSAVEGREARVRRAPAVGAENGRKLAVQRSSAGATGVGRCGVAPRRDRLRRRASVDGWLRHATTNGRLIRKNPSLHNIAYKSVAVLRFCSYMLAQDN